MENFCLSDLEQQQWLGCLLLSTLQAGGIDRLL